MKNSNHLSSSPINNDNGNNGNNNSNDNGNNNRYVYDKDLCYECIRNNNKLGKVRNCPHCGSENYDTGCVPAIAQVGKPTNCVPKELSLDQAYRVCKAKSNSSQKCQIVEPKATLSYQKNECGDDYYCVYDESDSCSYNVCNLNDDFIYGKQSICACEKVTSNKDPHKILKLGEGRECVRGYNCVEYTPSHGAPELYSDPQLMRFYGGYNTYMNTPNLNTWYAAAIQNKQII